MFAKKSLAVKMGFGFAVPLFLAMVVGYTGVQGFLSINRALERADDSVQLVQMIQPCALPMAAAEHYGHIRATLQKLGQPIGNNDLWIAAHARAEGLVLVTNNEREFRRVPGLAVENWVAAA